MTLFQVNSINQADFRQRVILRLPTTKWAPKKPTYIKINIHNDIKKFKSLQRNSKMEISSEWNIFCAKKKRYVLNL